MIAPVVVFYALFVGLLALILTLAALSRRTERRILRALLEGGLKGSQLVERGVARQGSVYPHLTELERRGLVLRIGNRLPYVYVLTDQGVKEAKEGER